VLKKQRPREFQLKVVKLHIEEIEGLIWREILEDHSTEISTVPEHSHHRNADVGVECEFTTETSMSGTPMTSSLQAGLPTGNVILAAIFLDTPLKFAPQILAVDAMVAVDNTMTAEDKTMIAEDKTMTAEDKTMIAEDKTMVAVDKTMVATDKTMIAEDKTMVAMDKTRIAEDKTMVAVDKTMDMAMVAVDKTMDMAMVAITITMDENYLICNM